MFWPVLSLDILNCFCQSQFAKCLDILASLNFLSDCISGYREVAVCEPCLWARGLKWKRCKEQHTFEIQKVKDEIQNNKRHKRNKSWLLSGKISDSLIDVLWPWIQIQIDPFWVIMEYIQMLTHQMDASISAPYLLIGFVRWREL